MVHMQQQRRRANKIYKHFNYQFHSEWIRTVEHSTTWKPVIRWKNGKFSNGKHEEERRKRRKQNKNLIFLIPWRNSCLPIGRVAFGQRVLFNFINLYSCWCSTFNVRWMMWIFERKRERGYVHVFVLFNSFLSICGSLVWILLFFSFLLFSMRFIRFGWKKNINNNQSMIHAFNGIRNGIDESTFKRIEEK